ncbi:hypothetical protein [Parendozoicomonas haliclonae]|uniref:Apolipoprotein N-acyltransferase n=1 Tax=Parendozoicomonas haliclonae TaxID=1960125 RepID=A0A1X7AN33_9GAMM|nr:hypothetical protein [Parendozoicomonas haliclonae]SMA49685.1 apolipoprotein N-acyltransferase [Parendozoicomonas haliclonae]
MKKNSAAPLLELSSGLTAGIFIPLGQIPLNFWPLSLLGFALLYYRLQSFNKWLTFCTVAGFSIAYFISGQLWIFNSLYLGNSHSTEELVSGALMLFIVPACICTFIMGLYPACCQLMNVQRFTVASSILFSALWGLFELIYALIPPSFPLLISGYAVLGHLWDPVLPILGVLGSGFLLVLLSCLFAASFYALLNRKRAKFYWLLPCLIIMLLSTFCLPDTEWTRRYDNRVFHYRLQINSNPDKPDSFFTDTSNPIPRLIILGGVDADAHRPYLLQKLPDLSNNKDSAFLVLMPRPEHCPDVFCSIGEGEGCSLEKLRTHKPAVNMQNCNLSRLPIKKSAFARHPSVDSNRLLVMNNGTDGLPFLAIDTVSGSEIIVAFDIPYRGHVIRERLLHADRARALETGRPVVRYSNQGVSAEINHMGIIEGRFLPEQDRVDGELTPMVGKTPFMYLGRYAFLALLATIFIAFAYRRLFQSL